MERQLVLLDDLGASGEVGARTWRLDERTKELGREGLALARAALRDAARRATAA